MSSEKRKIYYKEYYQNHKKATNPSINPYVYSGLEHEAMLEYCNKNKIKTTSLQKIFDAVCEYFEKSGVELNMQYKKGTGKREYVYPKMIFSYLAIEKRHTGESIKQFLGYKNPSNILHQKKAIKNLMFSDKQTIEDIDSINEILSTKNC